ncbi:hypothetical protein BaRGS_00029560 [Batillaria attramentaria]|uniref:Uncharacterized protein n=1 Tax=Batillaria attramentaria TaxID=370345 RepID=A0ABD0JWY1_9CAEN
MPLHLLIHSPHSAWRWTFSPQATTGYRIKSASIPLAFHNGSLFAREAANSTGGYVDSFQLLVTCRAGFGRGSSVHWATTHISKSSRRRVFELQRQTLKPITSTSKHSP